MQKNSLCISLEKMAILIPENEQQKFRISDSLEVEELPIFEMDAAMALLQL